MVFGLLVFNMGGCLLWKRPNRACRFRLRNSTPQTKLGLIPPLAAQARAGSAYCFPALHHSTRAHVNRKFRHRPPANPARIWSDAPPDGNGPTSIVNFPGYNSGYSDPGATVGRRDRFGGSRNQRITLGFWYKAHVSVPATTKQPTQSRDITMIDWVTINRCFVDLQLELLELSRTPNSDELEAHYFYAQLGKPSPIYNRLQQGALSYQSSPAYKERLDMVAGRCPEEM